MRANGVYTCGAGVNHYDTAQKTNAWKRLAALQAEGDAHEKVAAHDDYRLGIRLFRERIPVQTRAIADEDHWSLGYMAAIRDMDRAMLDAINARHDEEES